jgi:hypothetical protein
MYVIARGGARGLLEGAEPPLETFEPPPRRKLLSLVVFLKNLKDQKECTVHDKNLSEIDFSVFFFIFFFLLFSYYEV